MGRKHLETRPATSSSPKSSMTSLAVLFTLGTATAVTAAVGAASTATRTTSAATSTAAVASGRNHRHVHHTSFADALLFVSPSAPRARGWVTGSTWSDAAAIPSPRRAQRSSWGDSGALKNPGSQPDFFLLPGGGGLRMTSSAGEEDGEVKSRKRKGNERPIRLCGQ